MPVRKAGEPHEFTPPGSAYTYTLRTPSSGESAVAEEQAQIDGGRQYYAMDLARVFRDEMRRIAEREADPEVQRSLGLVEEWYERADSALRQWRDQDTEENREAFRLALDYGPEVAAIERLVHDFSEVYRTACAKSASWPKYYGRAVAKRFLAGWTGPDLPQFRRGFQGTPKDLLDLVPDAHLVSLGAEFDRLLAPSDQARKNSPSASSGPPRLDYSTSPRETTPPPNGHDPSGISATSGSESSTSTRATS